MTESDTLTKRQRAKAETAHRVLEAARGIFETSGYEAATIRKIAQDAGMSTGAVFANYEDKRALYIAAFGHPPISPELGRQLVKAVQALHLADALDAESDSPAYGLAQRFATSTLEAAGIPPIAVPTGMEPNKAIERFLEEQSDAGPAFRQYVLGQEGERIDVTTIG